VISLVFGVAAACGFFACGFLVGRRHTHAWTLNLSASRVWLECPLCGLTSPGWNLSITPPPSPSPLVHPLDRGAAWPMILH
jgi:hypothetical protein